MLHAQLALLDEITRRSELTVSNGLGPHARRRAWNTKRMACAQTAELRKKFSLQRRESRRGRTHGVTNSGHGAPCAEIRAVVVCSGLIHHAGRGRGGVGEEERGERGAEGIHCVSAECAGASERGMWTERGLARARGRGQGQETDWKVVSGE
jgi:hypothetical protein